MSLPVARFLLIAFLVILTACEGMVVTGSGLDGSPEPDVYIETDTAPDSKADRIDEHEPTEPSQVEPTEEVPDDSHLEAVFNHYGVDYLAGLPTGDEQHDNVCARGFRDRFSRWYCGSDRPTVSSLDELLVALELKVEGADLPKNFAATGHSSSLVMRRTSSINPRIVYFDNPGPVRDRDYVAAGFVRGDFFVEIAAFDRELDQLNFYLVKADKACEPDCTNGDRFMPRSEEDWEGIRVYPTEDLANTPLDCLSCHKPQNVDPQMFDQDQFEEGTAGFDPNRRILRMQELVFPWTHWFREDGGSSVLLEQFASAHRGEERYGAIPVERFAKSDPAALEQFVRAAGFGAQPNMFDGEVINNDSPEVDVATPPWRRLYEEALAGRQISPPYFGIDPFDETKVAAAAQTYRNALDIEALEAELPDMNDVFRDDVMDELGFEAGSNLDAKGIVQHRCGTCHDGRYPELSRADFDVADFPNNLTATQKSTILSRIQLGKSSPLRMPPTLFTDLSPEQIELIKQALK